MRRSLMHTMAALLLAAAPGWAQIPPTVSPPAPMGKLGIIVSGKVTTWKDAQPIPAGTVVTIRLYGNKSTQVERTLKDSAPTADRIVFRRPDNADLVSTYCYSARAWVDSDADGVVDPGEESAATEEACGKFVLPAIVPPPNRVPAAPLNVTVESP